MNTATARSWVQAIRRGNEKVEAEVLAVIQHCAMTGSSPLPAFTNGHTDAMRRLSELLLGAPQEIRDIAMEQEARVGLLFAMVLGLATGMRPIDVLHQAKTERTRVEREMDAQIAAAEGDTTTTH